MHGAMVLMSTVMIISVVPPPARGVPVPATGTGGGVVLEPSSTLGPQWHIHLCPVAYTPQGGPEEGACNKQHSRYSKGGASAWYTSPGPVDKTTPSWSKDIHIYTPNQYLYMRQAHMAQSSGQLW